MILGQQEANKVLPLISNLEAYAAFQELLNIVHKNAYEEAKSEENVQRAIGKLVLIDELKELRDRLKDSLNNGRPTANQPFL